MDQFVAPAQTQSLHQSRNLGEHGKTHVGWTRTVHNQIFRKRIFSPSLPVNGSRSAPAGAQLLLLSWGCFRNQVHANLESLNEDADPVESLSSPGSGGRSRVLHESWQTHLYCKSGSKNDWVSRMRPLVQSHRSGSVHPTHTLSSSYMSASIGLLFGAHSLQFHRRWCQLFQMSRALHATGSVPKAPYDPEPYLIL